MQQDTDARLAGKRALLAGAGARMGRATALLFAQEGARVAVMARTAANSEQTAELITTAGGDAIAIAGDAASPDAAANAVDRVVAEWGGLDVLYYGAGGFFEPDRQLADLDAEFWHRALANNLDGLYHLVQRARPQLRDGGSIVTIAASFSVRQEGNPAYGAAKGGLIGFSQSLARELFGEGIRVNCIASGLIRAALADGPVRPVTGLGRRGAPADIAHAAAFLASDEASWVTGQVLAVDGGIDIGGRPLWEHERQR